MNDTAKCENGLLLFGLDKHADKWRALIIAHVFVAGVPHGEDPLPPLSLPTPAWLLRHSRWLANESS